MQEFEIPIWKEAPFIRIVLPLMIGILWQWYLPLPFFLVLSALGTSLLLSFIYARLSLLRKFQWRFWSGINISLLFIFIGMLLLSKADDRCDPHWYGHVKSGYAWQVVVSEPPEVKQNSYSLRVTVKSVMVNHHCIPVTGNLRVLLKKESKICPLQYGDVCWVLKKAKPIVNSGNPGSFNLERYQAFHHLYEQVYISSSDIIILPEKQKAKWKVAVQESQRKILSVLRHYLSKDLAVLGIAEALLIGYKPDLDKGLVNSYSNTGVVHIIAISGLHLGLICMVLVWLFDRIPGLRKMIWAKAIMVMMCLWMFSLMTGASASVLRSAVMFTVILLGRCLQRESGIVNSLAASAFLLLVYDPYLLWDVGFQLSYLAIIGIVLLQKPIQQWMSFDHWLLEKIGEMMSITLAAQMVTTPICLFYFHQFPNYFMLSNLIAVPLSTLVLFAELLLILLSPFPIPAQGVAILTEWLIKMLNAIIQKIGKWPYAVTDNIVADVLSTCLLYLCLLALLLLFLKKWRRMMWPALLFFTCWLFYLGGKKIQFGRQQRWLVLNTPHHSGLLLVRGRHAYFSGDSDLIKQPATYRFYVRPVMQEWGLQHPPQFLSASSPSSFMVRMGNRRIMVIGNDFHEMIDSRPVQPDIILIRHQPSLNFNKIGAFGRNAIWIFDASNALWKIEQWKKQCDALHLRCISIPENGALFMDCP